MHLRKIFFLSLVLICLIQFAQAGEQMTLSPDGGHSNQKQISEALKNGDVYLSAGVYEVDDTIILPPNRALRGDPNAIVRVWSGSSQWFTGLKGVISCGDVVAHDNIISGFQMDGNIGNLPKSYADSRAETSHDCEKLIILHGYSNQFASNITISHMKLYNSFSDGAYILFGDHIDCSDNLISNCQHEGLYFSCLKNGMMYRNKIAGITSDAARLDNCVNCKVFDNIFFSYNGESYGAFKGGQAGLQVANAGSSHGYNAANKPQMTDRVEITNNTFADPGRTAIWLHNYGGSVYVHDNYFKDAAGIETQGIPIGDISKNISVNNPPTLEMSEEIFSSIFDVLNTTFTSSGKTNQIADDFNYTVVNTEQGKIAGGIKILGFNNWIVIDNKTYISNPDDAIVKSSIVRNPSLTAWSGDISTVNKTINVTIENGTAKATLTAKVQWYDLKRNADGKYSKQYKTSVYQFTDTSSPAPDIFKTPSNITGIIYQYPTDFTLSIPSTGLTSIQYEYDGNSSEHIFLVGQRNSTVEGVEYTEYSNLEHWEGKLQHQEKWVHVTGVFDKSKLKVVAHTPYNDIEVTDFKIVQKNYPNKFMAGWLAPFIWVLIILSLGCWYLWKHLWY